MKRKKKKPTFVGAEFGFISIPHCEVVNHSFLQNGWCSIIERLNPLYFLSKVASTKRKHEIS